MYHLFGMTLNGLLSQMSGLFSGRYYEMTLDLWFALVLWAVAGSVALAYSVRTLFRGKATFSRIDKQGGSALLSKNVMQGGYWFFQPLGRALVFFHVTPNQVSFASLGFGAVAGVCLALGHFGSAAVFGTISAVLDALDGMVARLTGNSSDAGEVLDAAVDRYVEFFMLFGIVVYYRQIPVLMILAASAMIGSFMVSYSSAKAEALHVDPPKGSMRRPERCLYLLVGAALSPITIPWLERVREFPIAIAHPMVVAMGLIGVLANVSAIERYWAIAKSVRSREADLKRVQQRVSETQLIEVHDEEVHHEPVTRY